MPTRRLPFHVEFPVYAERMVVIGAHTRLWARMTDKLDWQLVDPVPATRSEPVRSVGTNRVDWDLRG